MRPDDSVEDALAQALRSQYIRRKTPEADATQDVAQYLRSERAAEQAHEERVRTLYSKALLEGTLIFRGAPTPASSAGATLEVAARKVLGEAAAKIYPSFHLVNIRPGTDLAAKFLDVERLDRMPKDRDPLGFVGVVAGRPRIDVKQPALAEALRIFKEMLHDAGAGRLQGNAIQDRFAAAPYGWSKDATRYVFAALLVAGEVVLHTAGGTATTAGPIATEAMRNTQSFGRVGVSLRGSRPGPEERDRAATRLQDITGQEVLPLEDQIGAAVYEHMPVIMAQFAALPDRLRLLGLAGEPRAEALLATGRDLQGQDGAAAIGLLGAVASSFPADLDWARAVARALDNGAESEVQDARALVAACDELADLAPTLPLIEETERATLGEIVAAETFYERLPDLRGITRRVRERATAAYRDRWAGYGADLLAARSDLEALPDWGRLADEDRNDIAGRLHNALPATPAGGQELPGLRRLLFVQGALPALQRRLEAEVDRRVPIIVIKEGGPEQPVDLPLSSVASTAVIATEQELQVWLGAVGAGIRNSMAAGAPVRIQVRQ